MPYFSIFQIKSSYKKYQISDKPYAPLYIRRNRQEKGSRKKRGNHGFRAVLIIIF